MIIEHFAKEKNDTDSATLMLNMTFAYPPDLIQINNLNLFTFHIYNLIHLVYLCMWHLMA